METEVKVDLTNFRMETRKWLEDNCPDSMREKLTDPNQVYWGGRMGEFDNEDQKIWFKKMLEKSIQNEDYIIAAKLRDELNIRKSIK